MADEKWQNVRKIFDSALRQEPEKRDKFVRAACGNDIDLLAEVESLLSSHDGADSFLEMPAVARVAEVIESNVNRLERGTCFGHYEICEQIGSGGMGEVYLANDMKLDRQVALKVLSERLGHDKSNLQRFVHEAKAASALNHPNILVIHEIGESDGLHYMVSEYIEGRTLREILSRGHLSMTEVLDIAIQTANALSAAHDAHLVHRDIKPENIMIRPDRLVKVLDFGLAKLVEKQNKSVLGLAESTTQRNQTAKGVILGTINYMSPEQARGLDVDARTDIWSLGIVLYEMLAGKPPFASETTSDTISAILSKEPASLSAEIPKELKRIVAKTLRKDRNERYHHIKDLLIDLRDLKQELEFEARRFSVEMAEGLSQQFGQPASRSVADSQLPEATTGSDKVHATSSAEYIVTEIKQHKRGVLAAAAIFLFAAIGLGYWLLSARTTLPPGQARSIAVLPLKPINSNNRNELYEIGIADSVIHKVSSMDGFIVRPLSVMRRYESLEQDPLAAGTEQKVDYVLASNYQLADGKIRVTSQLFQVANGEIVETYKTEKETSNLFSMQDAIANEIGNVLSARFGRGYPSRTVKRGTNNQEAYRLYLQGKYLLGRMDNSPTRKAVELFDEAIKLDPNYAAAWAGKAEALSKLGYFMIVTEEDSYLQAKPAAEKALALDETLAEAHTVMAELKRYYELNFPEADTEYRRAIELDPSSGEARSRYALHLCMSRRFDEAIAEIQKAINLDPASLDIQRTRGEILYFSRRYDEAIAQLSRIVELDPNFQAAYFWMHLAYEMKGDYAAALEWSTKRDELIGNHKRAQLQRDAYESSGWEGIRRMNVETMQSADSTRSYRIAVRYGELGDKDLAFEYLNKALKERDVWMNTILVDPAVDSLRNDPRFDELLKRAGL